MSEECGHTVKDECYGFRRTDSFRGLGVYEFCVDCNKTLSFSDDMETNSKDEIEHNKKRMAEIIKGGSDE